MDQRNLVAGIASLGRGTDSALVHMSPSEVQALQRLAEQHGGSLTINPETGLPEAGFLSSLLPLIAGVGLMAAGPMTGGASWGVLGKMSALKAGMLMGGGALLASGGDWRQAAKWGLGGYGGASLYGGLTAAAAQGAVPATAATTVVPTVPLAGSGGFNTVREGLTGLTIAPGSTIIPSGGFQAAAAAPTGFGAMTTGLGNVIQSGAEGKLAREAFTAGVKAGGIPGLGVKTAGLAALAPAYLQEPEPLEEVDVGGTEDVAYPAYAPLNRRVLAVSNAPYSGEGSSEQDWFSEPDYRAYDPNVDPWNAFYQSGTATGAQGGIVSLNNGGSVGEQSYFQDRTPAPAPTAGTMPFSFDYSSLPAATRALFPNLANYSSAAGASNLGREAITPTGTGDGEQLYFQDRTPAPQTNLQQQQQQSAYAQQQQQQQQQQQSFPNSGVRFSPGWMQNYIQQRDYPKEQPADSSVDSASFSQIYSQPPHQWWHPIYATEGMLTNLQAGSETTASETTEAPVVPPPLSAEPLGAKGGIVSLQTGGSIGGSGGGRGGLTTGRGDGMSDEIMTTIAGQQRAALSPGEFVVPADVVSGIGNGDTNSGAKRLYAMMDNIRDGRTGKTKQPQRINPRLPV